MALAGGLQWEGVGADIPEPPAAPTLPLTLLLNAAWFVTHVHRVPEILAAGTVYAFWLFAILGAHEMGHYLACRYYKIPATLPFFIPGPPPLGSFGALIRIRGIIPDRKALFDVAAAGPIAGFVIALPVLLVGLARAEPWLAPPTPDGIGVAYGQPGLIYLLAGFFLSGQDLQVASLFGAGWTGMLVTSLNLFPVGQLDGGHAAYAMSRRTHRLAARATLLGMVALVVVQIVYFGQFPAYLVWFGILIWMRDRHPRLQDEITPLGTGRKWVALLLLIIFFCSFIPVPFIITGG